MALKRRERIALVGNPNSGKSSLFNFLTGLNQKTGNFPGVTVEKKTGLCVLNDHQTVEIIDLPGIYSIYPRSLDEKIVTEILLNHRSPSCPDKLVVVLDSTNLQRGLLLATQCIDLGLPTVLALNMTDLATKAGLRIDFRKLSDSLHVPVVPIEARRGMGLVELKKAIASNVSGNDNPLYQGWREMEDAVNDVRTLLGVDNDYEAYQLLQQPQFPAFLSMADQAKLEQIHRDRSVFPGKFQGAEVIQRYAFIQHLVSDATQEATTPREIHPYTSRLDKVLTHRVWGYLIFFTILLVIFQSIFVWASVPMNWIDLLFATTSDFLNRTLPAGPLSDLIAKGIVPGLGGILIFIPQIAFLFAFIALLEETGYMARVVFIMDKLMRKVGLNGKSVVPLISGVACAIPAIMATRTIGNWKERTITILVTPFMSCSARLPVFTILIGLVIPSKLVLGFLSLQGLTLMALYLLGFLAAIGSAWIMKHLIGIRERSYLMMELPSYRWPKWSNVGFTIYEKTKSFVFGAGKIIMAISIILWGLSSYGPRKQMEDARVEALRTANAQGLDSRQTADRVASFQLENSFAGVIGRGIEPAIKPLGYDWKIGIALVTSFAAREVFVGTMATIYSIGSVEDHATIQQRLRAEKNPETGGPRFTLAVGLSLLVFYTFAMQCMSTLAVVYRETGGWKWPIIQLCFMTGLAYFSAFIVFHLFA